MLLYKFVKLFYLSVLLDCLAIFLGDVSDALASLSLLLASGDHDWRSNY